jgi:hypothetical protein
MDGRASPHHSTGCDGVVSPPVCATGLSLIARGGLIGAAPRGQPRTSAVTLRHGRNGLSARREETALSVRHARPVARRR